MKTAKQVPAAKATPRNRSVQLDDDVAQQIKSAVEKTGASISYLINACVKRRFQRKIAFQADAEAMAILADADKRGIDRNKVINAALRSYLGAKA